MSLKEQLQKDLMAAMKAKDQTRVAVIRGLRNAIRQREIDGRKELTDSDILGIFSHAAKQRRESIKAYQEGQRDDLVAQERAELAVIEDYLPQALSPQELQEIIAAVIAETGAQTLKDIGKVMPAVMRQVRGKADGSEVQKIVRSKLS